MKNHTGGMVGKNAGSSLLVKGHNRQYRLVNDQDQNYRWTVTNIKTQWTVPFVTHVHSHSHGHTYVFVPYALELCFPRNHRPSIRISTISRPHLDSDVLSHIHNCPQERKELADLKAASTGSPRRHGEPRGGSKAVAASGKEVEAIGWWLRMAPSMTLLGPVGRG